MVPSALRSASRLSVMCLLVALPVRAADRPPVPPIDPAGLPGPLVLVGGKELPKNARDAFFILAGKKKAKIVVIPTAIATADDPKTTEEVLEPWKALEPLSVEVLHTRDRKTAADPKFVKPLADATGVWFTNGHTDRLVNAYCGTLFEKELKKLHARGGVVGGAGGGASVMGSLVVAGGEEKPVAGFGLLPGFVLDPKERLEGLIADNPGYVGLRLPDGAALGVRRRLAFVIGKPAVTVCVAKGAGKPAAADEHGTEDVLDLVQLRRAAANRAAKEPFPPARPPVPEVPKGSLVLSGGGMAGPEIWKKFIALAGGPDALIVVIPTERRELLPEESVEEEALRLCGAKNVRVLHTRDPRTADDPKFSEVLTRAGGVWFGSGRQWRFVDAYAGTLTEKRCHELLARGGAVGGGSSGASIQGEYLPRGHPLGNEVMAAEGYEKGFGFLPGCAVDQHFFARKRTADMTGLMKRYPQYLGIGIDEGTALVVQGTVAEVIGESKVAFYDTAKKPVAGGKDYEEVKAGEKYDLKSRAKVAK